MNQEVAWLIIALAFLGGIGWAVIWIVRRYMRDAKAIHEKYKDKKVVKTHELPLPVPEKPQHIVVTIGWCIAIYWLIFGGIIHWLSGDAEVSDETMMAPILLPLYWIWSILSSHTFWYVIGATFTVWWINKLFLEPIHKKLDRILKRLGE
jgi:hypothetical protein